MEEPLGVVPPSDTSEGNQPGLVASAGRFLFRLLKELVGTIEPAVLIAVFINVFGALDPVFIGQTIGGGIDFNDFDLEDLMQIQDGGEVTNDTDS